MNAREDIARLLEEWRTLTQAEGAAIRSATWAKLREIQARKVDLQKSLAFAEANWLAENPAAVSSKPFQLEIGRLISLESRNAELLAAQLRRARLDQERLEQAGRNLRKVRSSYTLGRASTAWQCYS
jgi:hypothetical protein